jgi:hypothetical protein
MDEWGMGMDGQESAKSQEREAGFERERGSD